MANLILRQYFHMALFVFLVCFGVGFSAHSAGSDVCHFLFQKKGQLGSGIAFSKNWVGENNLFRRYSYGAMRPAKKALVYLPAEEKSEKKTRKKKSKYAEDEWEESRKAKKIPEETILVPSHRLRIEAVMQDFQLSRAQAVEVQAILRRYYPRASNDDFLQIVEQVRRGASMSGVKYENLARAKFIVALDVDGTLLDQKYRSIYRDSKVFTHRFMFDGEEHGVTMAPGWEKFFRQVKSRGGSIVIYSRNSDELIQNMFKYITIEGMPVSDFVDGIYSSSHLVLPPQFESYVQERNLHDLVLKDLRILDSTKTIIVDDEPMRIWQGYQTRTVPEFKARKLDPDFYETTFRDDSPFPRSSSTEPESDSLMGALARAMVEMNPFIPQSQKNKTAKKSEKSSETKFSPEKEIEKVAEGRSAIFDDIIAEIDWALVEAAKQNESFVASYRPFSAKAIEERYAAEQAKKEAAELLRKQSKPDPKKAADSGKKEKQGSRSSSKDTQRVVRKLL